MGMTKALMERILVEANLRRPATRFVCVRYGNVIASRGSVVPLFLEQIARGGPVTVTPKEMTRFLLTLDQRRRHRLRGARAARGRARSTSRACRRRGWSTSPQALIGGRDIPIVFTGIRPGEKIHEIMVSEEECHRTIERDGYYVDLSDAAGAREAPTAIASRRSHASTRRPTSRSTRTACASCSRRTCASRPAELSA